MIDSDSFFACFVDVDSYFEVNCAPKVVYWTLCFASVLLIMDALFRGYKSLPKKSRSGSSLSPFSSSPSQLQDVTSGANGSFVEQNRCSPIRGRSVKEYDEQLATLKKENFSLKLRIYLLEERMSGGENENLRKNIEWQVEAQSLRTELAEKQDLLCQAVKAMELSDGEHKKELEKRDAQLVEYLQKITALEETMKSLAESRNDFQTKQDLTTSLEEASDLKLENSKAKEEIESLHEQILELENQLSDEREHSAILEHEAREVECLQSRCNNLETELQQKSDKLQELLTELEQNGHNLSSCNLRIRTLEDALMSTKSDLNFKSQEIVAREKTIQELLAEMEGLKKLVEDGHSLCDKEQRQTENLKSAVMTRDNTIADLETRLEKSKSVIRKLEAKIDSVTHENKRLQDELQTMKVQRRSKNPDSPDSTRLRTLDYSPRKGSARSNSSSSSSSGINDSTDVKLSHKLALNMETIEVLQEEISRKESKISKLEEEHKKACRMIQHIIGHSKNLQKQLAEKQRILHQKEQLLRELRGSHETTAPEADSKDCVPFVAQFNSSPCSSERENSVEESDDVKALEQLTDNQTLEWEKEIQALMEVLEEREEQLKQYKEKYEFTTSTLQMKDNRITELECKVEELKSELNCVSKKLDEVKNEKSQASPDKSNSWLRVTEEKDKQIEQLQNEVRKYTSNLQGIVNNELWDKNREIEKFQKKLKVKDQEISQLEREISAKDMQLNVLKDKISELGVQVGVPSSLLVGKPNGANVKTSSEEYLLKEQLKAANEECDYLHKTVEELRQKIQNTPERDSDNKMVKLKSEIAHLQQEYEKSEKCRLETVNLCSVLTTRLEELAYFLDSLLKHTSVLGVLGSKQRSAIKQAIDQSLDLSKSFSISMLNDDQSLAQLSSISGLLNTSHTSVFDTTKNELPLDVSLSYNSHLSHQRGDTHDLVTEQAEIIRVLRAQIERMKKEIDLRDMEISQQNKDRIDSNGSPLKNDNDLVKVILDLQNKSPQKSSDVLTQEKIYQSLIADKTSSFKNHADTHSESEAWSEPDRCVSQERIGLGVDSLKSSSSANLSRSWMQKSVSADGASSETTEEEKSLVKNRSPSKRGSETLAILQENINLLETKLKEKENELLTLRHTLMDLDNKYQQTTKCMTTDLQKLLNEKQEVDETLKQTRNTLVETEEKYTSVTNELKTTKMQKDDAFVNIAQMKQELTALKDKLKLLEQQLKNTSDTHESEMKQCEDQWKQKIKKLEAEAESKIKEIKMETDNLKMQYSNEYIQKAEMNKHVAKMKVLYEELESTKKDLINAQAKLKYKEESEMDLKKKIQDIENSHRETVVSLKRQVNETMLQVSQTALERTKVSKEKLQLEAEIRKMEERENEKMKEFEEREKEYMNVKNNMRKQLSQTEQQKCNLQLMVSKLETVIADLRNRLVKVQTGNTEGVWSRSISTSPPKITELTSYRTVAKHSLGQARIGLLRQRSDMSGYLSEDVLLDENDPVHFNRSAPETYHWFPQTSLTASDAPDSRNVANSSPDLGIESDQGRFSSLETNATRPLLQTLELTASMNNLLSADQLENNGQFCNIIAHKNLESENIELKKSVSRLQAGLENSRSQLSAINQKKKQVEKAVCKEIHKTSVVLRKARANLDSGSEN